MYLCVEATISGKYFKQIFQASRYFRNALKSPKQIARCICVWKQIFQANISSKYFRQANISRTSWSIKPKQTARCVTLSGVSQLVQLQLTQAKSGPHEAETGFSNGIDFWAQSCRILTLAVGKYLPFLKAAFAMILCLDWRNNPMLLLLYFLFLFSSSAVSSSEFHGQRRRRWRHICCTAAQVRCLPWVSFQLDQHLNGCSEIYLRYIWYLENQKRKINLLPWKSEWGERCSWSWSAVCCFFRSINVHGACGDGGDYTSQVWWWR